MYVHTNLKKINLQGNMIKREGFYQLLRALQHNKVLKELIVADNQIEEDEEMVKFMLDILAKNSTLTNIDLTFN